MSVALRRLVPYTLLPLSLIACVLASLPWLRAFPADVVSVPLFGAAVLSVLAPVVVVGIGVRRLWLSALIDLLLFVFYELIVTLREPGGFGDLYTGLVHGPAQILSFALPLVSPRTLLVAPVALCWLCGAVTGECVARGWQTIFPYLTLVATFGLAYGGTARGITSSADGRHYDTLFAGALLFVLLLLRAGQAWVVQDESAETTEPEGLLPLRGLAVGAAVALAVTAVAAGAVQSAAFSGQPAMPARVPPIDESRPVTPLAFVSGLRPDDPTAPGKPLFQVTLNRAASNYVAIASVDYYDGDSWSFSRTFRPSGGVIPPEADPSLRPSGPPVTQEYQIAGGPMTTVPWMPHLDRAQRVTGVSVNIDAESGMIVPAGALRAGDDYTVVSAVPRENFVQLRRSALVGTSGSQLDTALPNGLAAPLATLIRSLAQETGVSSALPVPFLQAVAQQLRTRTSLAGLRSATASASSGPAAASSAAAPSGSPSPRPSSTTASSSAPAHAGGNSFANVLASIRGTRSGTPEQFATLVALIARELQVPARVVSGFRLPVPRGTDALSAGTYTVTSAQAWSWVEIPVRGLGWVVLDAAPGRYAGQPAEPTVAKTRSLSSSPTPSKKALLTRSNGGGHAVAPPSRTPRSAAISKTALVVIVLLSAIAAVVLFLGLLLARKQLRVRRRRHGDPRHRVVGAWQESIDVLVEAGLPDLSSATTAEVTAAAAAQFGPEPAAQARAVGQAADLAIFSPATPVNASAADAAWRSQAELGRSVHRGLRWPDRIAARLRYNRPRRAGGPAAPASWPTAAESRASRGAGRDPAPGRARTRSARPGRRRVRR